MSVPHPLLRTGLPWLAGAAILVAAATGVWLLWHHDPNTAGSIFPPCMFRALTGWYCIGCGMTRAMHALVHGDILRALAMNPLGVIMLVLGPLMLLHARGWRPRALRPLMSVATSPILWLTLLPAFWIGRNLPWWPFTLLAPG